MYSEGVTLATNYISNECLYVIKSYNQQVPYLYPIDEHTRLLGRTPHALTAFAIHIRNRGYNYHVYNWSMNAFASFTARLACAVGSLLGSTSLTRLLLRTRSGPCRALPCTFRNLGRSISDGWFPTGSVTSGFNHFR